ncbi:MAG: transcriptional repressor, CopY family [Frankiales bacterium]|nr:transcriptional repressor, CopY family [Frankiales bacterium]
MPAKGNRSRGALEQEILACLVSTGRPMTPAEVQAELGRDLAYTTVMTTLSRLHDKRALDRCLRGRAFRYSLAGDAEGVRANVTAHQMHKLLADGTDRASVLTRFVAELNPDDEQLLAELLARSDEQP